MPKPSVMLAAILLFAALGYLAFSPDAARDLENWVRRQVGSKPQLKDGGSLNYMPVVPGKGL